MSGWGSWYLDSENPCFGYSKDKPPPFQTDPALPQAAAMLPWLCTFGASLGPSVSHKSTPCGGKGIKGRKQGGAETWRRILSQLYCTLSRPTSENPTGAITQSVKQVLRMVGGCDRCHGGHRTCNSGQRQLFRFLPPLIHPVTWRWQLLHTEHVKNYVPV